MTKAVARVEAQIPTPSGIVRLYISLLVAVFRFCVASGVRVVVPDVGAMDAISAIEIPTKRKPNQAARKVQRRPPGPPFPRPNATVDKTVSHVLMMIRANPKMVTKPKFRCRAKVISFRFFVKEHHLKD
jgi:hypothetical protein